MGVLLSATVALLALTLAPHLLFYFDITPKIVVLLVGTAMALPLVFRFAGPRSREMRWFELLLAAMCLSVMISTLFSADRALSFGGSNWRRFGLLAQFSVLALAWMVARHTASQLPRIRGLLGILALSGIPAALYGIAQYFGWDPFIDPKLYHIGEAPFTIVRPPGTLGYVSYFATYLLSVIFAGAALVLVEPKLFWRLVGAVAVVAGCVALVLTGTRAAMLGLLGGVCFLLLWFRPALRARVLGGFLAFALGMALFYFSPPGELLRSRTRWFIEDPRGGSRPLLWRDSLRMAAARWAAGWGPETFSIYFPRYQSAELARAYPEFYQESPHNIFLDTFATQGAPGLVLLAAVTALGFLCLHRSRREPEIAIYSAGLGAALIAILISQQFTSFTVPTAVYFYVTIALLVALSPNREQEQADSTSPNRDRERADSTSPNRDRERGDSRMRAAGAFAMLPTSLLLIVFAARLFEADRSLAQVDRLIRDSKLLQAIRAYQHVEIWAPPGMRTDLWYSRAITTASSTAKDPREAVQAWQEGFETAKQAAEHSEERQNAWYSLSSYYARQNDFAHTEQCLRQAISFAPNWFKPHWVLAQVLRLAGRLEEARAEALLATDLDGGKNPEVTRTLEEIRTALNISKK